MLSHPVCFQLRYFLLFPAVAFVHHFSSPVAFRLLAGDGSIGGSDIGFFAEGAGHDHSLMNGLYVGGGSLEKCGWYQFIKSGHPACHTTALYHKTVLLREDRFFCQFSHSPLFSRDGIATIVSMPGVACASIPPVSLRLTVCALAIPLAAAAAQEEITAGQAVENGALGILIIKARIHRRRKIRCQAAKGIPADVKDSGHIGATLYFLCSGIHLQTHTKIRK